MSTTQGYLAFLRAAIAPLAVIHTRIEGANSEAENLTLRLAGLHGNQWERESAAISPTRLRHIENAAKWETGAADEKIALATAVRPAALLAANLLVPAMETKLAQIVQAVREFSDTDQRAIEFARTTDVYCNGQKVIGALREQNRFDRGLAVNVILRRARFVEAILVEACKEETNFFQFAEHCPSAEHSSSASGTHAEIPGS